MVLLLPISSYAGSCSRWTVDRSTPCICPEPLATCPLSRAMSIACDKVSFTRSNVEWKSNAPPSLKVIFIWIKVWCGGNPPPVTGFRIPVQILGPKKGAETCVSWRFKMGAENDWSCAVGAAGRYTS